jgi:hypothetical protein
LLDADHDGGRIDEAGEVVDVAVGVVALDAAGQPADVPLAVVVLQVLLDLRLGEVRVAVLVEQAVGGGQDGPRPVERASAPRRRRRTADTSRPTR